MQHARSDLLTKPARAACTRAACAAEGANPNHAHTDRLAIPARAGGRRALRRAAERRGRAQVPAEGAAGWRRPDRRARGQWRSGKARAQAFTLTHTVSPSLSLSPHPHFQPQPQPQPRPQPQPQPKLKPKLPNLQSPKATREPNLLRRRSSGTLRRSCSRACRT